MTLPNPMLRGYWRRRPRPDRVGVSRGYVPPISVSAPGVLPSAPLLVGALSGGPTGRGRHPWGGRAVRHLPRRGSRATPALGAGQSLSWGSVTPRCAHALASTYPSVAGALRAAHGEAIVACPVDTPAWVIRRAGAVLRDSSSPRTATAEQFLVHITPEAIGYQMASRLKGYGQRVASGSAVPSAGGSSSRAPYPGEPADSAAPYHGSGYPTSAGGYAAAGAPSSRAPRSSWGPGPSDRGSAQEYPVDPPGYDHYGGYARDDHPHSPGRE